MKLSSLEATRGLLSASIYYVWHYPRRYRIVSQTWPIFWVALLITSIHGRGWGEQSSKDRPERCVTVANVTQITQSLKSNNNFLPSRYYRNRLEFSAITSLMQIRRCSPTMQSTLSGFFSFRLHVFFLNQYWSEFNAVEHRRLLWPYQSTEDIV